MAVNYFLSTVGSDVEVFNNYATFRQATADNESDIPGYLYEEVNAISYENNGSNCKALVNYFISRLQCQSPYVKTKVLNLLIHLVKSGHPNVLEHLRKYDVSIKKATNASVSPSDVYGQGVYANVRTLAKELLELIFSEELITENIQMEGLQTMCGLGSDASCKKLTGFGNVSVKQKTLGERVTQHVSNAVEKILSPNSDKELYYRQQMKILGESLPQYKPVHVTKTESCNTSSPSYQEALKPKLPQRNIRKVHVAGKPGGGWDDSDEDIDSTIDISASESVALASFEDSIESEMELICGVESMEEHKLVNDFAIDEKLEELKCSEIEAACRKSSSLNCDKICEFLMEKLSQNEKENVKLRCLVLLEYLLHYDVINLESVINIALPQLQKLSECRDSSIQIKSKKLSLIVESLSRQQPIPKRPKDLYLPLIQGRS